MSVDPNGLEPLACAKAGVINKGTGSGRPAEIEDRRGAAGLYTGAPGESNAQHALTVAAEPRLA
jgi:hypothetical protein